MFNSNDSQTMDMIYTIYMLISRTFTAWFKFIESLYNS